MAVDQLLSRVPFSVTPWTAAGSSILHCLPEFAQIMSIEPISSSAASFSFCLQMSYNVKIHFKFFVNECTWVTIQHDSLLR